MFLLPYCTLRVRVFFLDSGALHSDVRASLETHFRSFVSLLSIGQSDFSRTPAKHLHCPKKGRGLSPVA